MSSIHQYLPPEAEGFEHHLEIGHANPRIAGTVTYRHPETEKHRTAVLYAEFDWNHWNKDCIVQIEALRQATSVTPPEKPLKPGKLLREVVDKVFEHAHQDPYEEAKYQIRCRIDEAEKNIAYFNDHIQKMLDIRDYHGVEDSGSDCRDWVARKAALEDVLTMMIELKEGKPF